MGKRKRFHHVLTWRIAFYLFIGLVVSNGIFYYMMSRPLGRSYSGALLVIKDAHDAALRYALNIDLTMLVLLAGVVFVAVLLMSHRVSGPMYRFERTAESLSGGDFSVGVRLRRKDEMTDVAEEMDLAIKAVRTKLARLDSLAGALQEDVALLEKPGPHAGEARDAQAAIITRVNDGVREMREAVGHFKL